MSIGSANRPEPLVCSVVDLVDGAGCTRRSLRGPVAVRASARVESIDLDVPTLRHGPWVGSVGLAGPTWDWAARHLARGTRSMCLMRSVTTSPGPRASRPRGVSVGIDCRTSSVAGPEREIRLINHAAMATTAARPQGRALDQAHRRRRYSHSFDRSPGEDPESWIQVHGKPRPDWRDPISLGRRWWSSDIDLDVHGIVSFELHRWHSDAVTAPTAPPSSIIDLCEGLDLPEAARWGAEGTPLPMEDDKGWRLRSP